MKEILLENKPKLVKWLSLDYDIFLQHVQAKKLITESQYDELIDITNPKKGVIKLLDFVRGNGENVCRKFLDLLKEDDVNEFSSELREWIKTVDTKETTNKTGPSGIHVESNSTASDGGSVYAPVITGSGLGSVKMNMTAGPSGRSNVVENYQKPDRDCEQMPIQETTRQGPSDIQVKCKSSASDGGSVFAPVITGSSLGSVTMSTIAAPFGKSKVLANYQKPARDCEQRPIQDYQNFLKENTSKLVQKVKNIGPVIDDLDLHGESVANVRAETTNQEKMRKLLDCVNCESIAENLFKALCEHEKGLMDELLNN